MSSEPVVNRDDELIQAAQRQFHGLGAGHRPRFGRAPNLDVHGSSGAVGLPVSAETFPGYEVLLERHRGGQGVVYEAVQKATKRKVAIKVLYDAQGETALRRFEREIEILSQLRHPNIVTVHDSGAASGRFYYAMDLVVGAPLNQWVDVRRASLNPGSHAAARETFKAFCRNVVELFEKICDAVNAAHLRGVIHRDLKPGNILVDGSGEPRVLDFGLAKFTFGGSDDSTIAAAMTQTGQFVGSLPWSSPEQAAGSPNEIDTRTDVYALGVLLYHALTGQFPYRVTGNVADVVDQIGHAEPRPLEDALLSGMENVPQPSLWRDLRRPFDEEIQTIVTKCLQKDRDRRYQTAGDLGRDLKRYLAHDPIEAKRDSFGYILRKRLRRHRLPVIAAGSVLAAVVVGLIVSVVFWRRAEGERERAEAAQELAEKRLAEAETVTRLLEDMFGSPKKFPGKDMTIKDVLDNFAETAVIEVAEQPEVELRLRTTLFKAYFNLGEFEKAQQQADRVIEMSRALFGEGSREFAAGLDMLAWLRVKQADLAGAEELTREAVARDAASGREDEQARKTRFSHATTLEDQGKFDEAEEAFTEVLQAERQAPDKDPEIEAACLRHLGWIRLERRDLPGAEKLLREALAVLESASPGDDAGQASTLNDLASVMNAAGRPAEAVEMLERVAAVYRRMYGDKSPRLATTLSNLGLARTSLKEFDAAERVLTESLEIRRAVLPDHHSDVAQSLNNLARVLELTGQPAKAAELYEEALAGLVKSIGEKHPNALIVRGNLARTLGAAGSKAEAVAEYEKLLGLRREALPPGHADIVMNLVQLASLRLELGQFAEAEPVLRDCLAIREKALPAGHWLTANTRSMLGEAILGQDRADEAAPLLLSAYEEMKANPETLRERLKEAAARIVKLYEQTGDAEKAAVWRGRMNE